mmetsp:Transcript_10219/g.62363  ORF Transcript_10219/g.62363 Transcript_10219/m.62363 type:complete len:577 (-) Transcript_10219:2-1732(-)
MPPPVLVHVHRCTYPHHTTHPPPSLSCTPFSRQMHLPGPDAPHPGPPGERGRPYGSRTRTRIRTEEAQGDHVSAVVSWIVPVIDGHTTTTVHVHVSATWLEGMRDARDAVHAAAAAAAAVGGGGSGVRGRGDLLDVVEVLAGKVQELAGAHVDHCRTRTVHVVARMKPAKHDRSDGTPLERFRAERGGDGTRVWRFFQDRRFRRRLRGQTEAPTFVVSAGERTLFICTAKDDHLVVPSAPKRAPGSRRAVHAREDDATDRYASTDAPAMVLHVRWIGIRIHVAPRNRVRRFHADHLVGAVFATHVLGTRTFLHVHAPHVFRRQQGEDLLATQHHVQVLVWILVVRGHRTLVACPEIHRFWRLAERTIGPRQALFHVRSHGGKLRAQAVVLIRAVWHAQGRIRSCAHQLGQERFVRHPFLVRQDEECLAVHLLHGVGQSVRRPIHRHRRRVHGLAQIGVVPLVQRRPMVHRATDQHRLVPSHVLAVEHQRIDVVHVHGVDVMSQVQVSKLVAHVRQLPHRRRFFRVFRGHLAYRLLLHRVQHETGMPLRGSMHRSEVRTRFVRTCAVTSLRLAARRG